MKHFFILGTDPRYDRLADLISERGGTVFRTKKSLSCPAVWIFPLSAEEKTILSTLDHAAKGSLVLVGRKSPELELFATNHKMSLLALLEDKTYLEKNALATAEGTLAEVIRETDRTLPEMCVLVCGYGNCGKALSRLFWLCGCEVWVFSREESLKRAEEEGFNAFRGPKENLSMFDLILNTVPSPIFDDAFLSTLAKGAHFFQVASGLSGIPPQNLEEKGVFFHPLPGLPGRYASQSEAEAIFAFLKEHIPKTKVSEEP